MQMSSDRIGQCKHVRVFKIDCSNTDKLYVTPITLSIHMNCDMRVWGATVDFLCFVLSMAVMSFVFPSVCTFSVVKIQESGIVLSDKK